MTISLGARNEQDTRFGVRSEFRANSTRAKTAKSPHIGRSQLPDAESSIRRYNVNFVS
jgi:hypothetical protein